MPGDGMHAEDRHQRLRRDADLLQAFAPRGVDQLLAALDPARRHLDHVALPDREMRAEPELADQHDLVARQIDRDDDHHAPDPHDVARQRAVGAVGQRDAIALIAIEAAAEHAPAR